ncbi:MAG TPA: hypothetical protein IAD08_03045 [Candidatus Scatovivens faecipullorum]|jgi:hypothetical protein|nr:hypothetical protein [Candidatus Scatovivens faecipullorum]
MVEENLQGKYFSITDRKDVSTVIYQVNKTEKEFAKNSPKYTVERLEYSEEFVGDNKKKTFFVENPAPEGNPLVILSFAKEKVVINMGFLDYDTVRISKKPMPMKFKTIYNEEETDFKEFAYTPNMKRPISIIDPETGEEVKPILYFDEEANEVKGKCKLKPYKKYFAFEIREDKKK